MSSFALRFRFFSIIFQVWLLTVFRKERLIYTFLSYNGNPMNIDGNFDTITGLTPVTSQSETGTKVIIKWRNGRTKRVKLTSIEVSYRKNSKYISYSSSYLYFSIFNNKMNNLKPNLMTMFFDQLMMIKSSYLGLSSSY